MGASRTSLHYELDLEAMPERLRGAFFQLREDAATTRWLKKVAERPHGLWKLVAKRLLDRLLSHYDSNGLLDMYDMWLLGEEGWREFLGSRVGGRLLDVGAGDGRVTRELAACFESVEATETSRQMARRLRQRGYVCHELDLARAADVAAGPFDGVALLNVLDRSRYPKRLLAACVDRLRPEGTLVISTPLPLRQAVFVAGEAVDSEERLGHSSKSFEAALTELIETVLEPARLRILRYSRLPYLSRGDEETPLYALDAALLLCSKD